MSDLEREKVRAKNISNLLKGVAYLTFFLILGLVIINTYFIQRTPQLFSSILPPPVPFQLLVILGLALLSSIIVLAVVLLYQLYKLKKVALKDKNENSNPKNSRDADKRLNSKKRTTIKRK